MNLEEARIFIFAIANRDQSADAITPDEFNSYLARANEDKFRIECGLRESQTPIYFQNGQISTDALKPFIMRGFPLTGTGGAFTLPTDYVHLISMYHFDSNNRSRTVTLLNVDEYDAIQDNAVKFPTEQYPYATQQGNSVLVSPTTITTLKLSYLRKPVTPVWGYVTQNDEPIYDPNSSVQWEWEWQEQISICRLILGYLGINFRDSDLLQYAELTQQKGS